MLPDGQPRRNFHAVLFAVRSFYLDLLQWSLEDPARWATVGGPCPISEADVRGYVKETRRRSARMAERTRALVPVLPRLVAAAGQQLELRGPATAGRPSHARRAGSSPSTVPATCGRVRAGGPRPGRLLAQRAG